MADALITLLKDASATEGKEFATSDEFLKIQNLRRVAGDAKTGVAWRAVSEACGEVLLLYPEEPLPALWWAEARMEMDGFAGLADGVELIAALLETKWPNPDYELLAWLRDRLNEFVLRVPLVRGSDFTYTTILNSRWDPERAAEAIERLRWSGDRIEELREGLAVLVTSISKFVLAAGRHTWVRQPSYAELSNLPRQIRADLAARNEAIADRPASPPTAMPPETPEAGGVAAPSIPETVEVYLKLDGIDGDCTTIPHRAWIRAQSYKHSMESPGSEIRIEKRLDAASPKLYEACSALRVFAAATIDICRAPNDSIRLLRIELTDPLISSITQSAVSGDTELPLELITLRYGRVTWTYTQYGPDRIPEGVIATVTRAIS